MPIPWYTFTVQSLLERMLPVIFEYPLVSKAATATAVAAPAMGVVRVRLVLAMAEPLVRVF